MKVGLRPYLLNAVLLGVCNTDAAFALDSTQCSLAEEVVALWPHQEEKNYEDLGASLVYFEGSFSAEGLSGIYLHLVSCVSGEGLRMEVASSGREGQRDFDRREEGKALIHGLVSAEAQYTFADVSAVAAKAGFWTQIAKSNKEICACMALYPQDRGTKIKYDYQSPLKD